MIPLRIRVRKSATGSVIDMRSPARLRHAGDVALMGELAQADAAEPELAVHRPRSAAAAAARVGPRLVLRRARQAHDLGLLGHESPGYAATGSPARLSKPAGRPSREKGKPKPSSSANASVSVAADVVMVMSSP